MGTSSESGDHYSSQLSSRSDRFVSELFASAVENNWRDAEGFLDHFAVEAILEALASEDELRVRLLVEATGTHEKIAVKKSPMSAAEDLRLALDEGTTTPDAVLALFDADEWVRILGARSLWDFLCEDKFWNTDAQDKNAFTEALERVTETIHRAIQHKVLSETDVVEAVGFERLVAGLDEAQVRELLVSALEAGKDGEVFSAEALLDVFPLEQVLERVSLSFAWSEIVVQHVQQPLELGEGSAAPPRRNTGRAEPEKTNANRGRAKQPPADEQPKSKRTARRAAPPAELPEPPAPRPAPAREAPRTREAESRSLTPPASSRRRSSRPPAAAQTPSAPPLPRTASSAPPPPAARPQQSLPPPPPSARAGAVARQAPPPLPRQSSGPPPLPGSSAPPPPNNDPILAQAVSRLSRIDRLPSRHSEFPAAVLHAIESMYGELATVSDAQEQLNVIKDAFPNDLWRARAMLALLELLNPSAISSPGIAHESADALSIRLLTEERQLSRNAAHARNGRSGTH